MKSYQCLRGRRGYEDFEKNIYLYHALRFDWRVVFENLDNDDVEVKRNSEEI